MKIDLQNPEIVELEEQFSAFAKLLYAKGHTEESLIGYLRLSLDEVEKEKATT